MHTVVLEYAFIVIRIHETNMFSDVQTYIQNRKKIENHFIFLFSFLVVVDSYTRFDASDIKLLSFFATTRLIIIMFSLYFLSEVILCT